MSKSSQAARRIRQREQRRERKREEAISPKNQYGISDPTPYQAVLNIRRHEKTGG